MEEDCEHVWLDGVCQRCNDLEPLPDDELETVTVEVTWQTEHTVRVPKGTVAPDGFEALITLLCEQDGPDADLTAYGADAVAWEFRPRPEHNCLLPAGDEETLTPVLALGDRAGHRENCRVCGRPWRVVEGAGFIYWTPDESPRKG